MNKNNDFFSKIRLFLSETDQLKRYLPQINSAGYPFIALFFFVSLLLSLFSDYMPNHYSLLKQLEVSKKSNIKSIYDKFDSISIDYGIMEKVSSSIKLLPARFDWNDIGNWSSLSEYLPLDINNNATNTETLSLNARNNLIFSKNKKLVAMSNINDVILVETDDAILLLPKDDDQAIKKIYEKLGKDYK